MAPRRGNSSKRRSGPPVRSWRESKSARRARTAEIIHRLRGLYPDASAELTYTDPFQTADRRDPIGADHRRGGQQGDADAICALPHGGGAGVGAAGRRGRHRAPHRVLPTESQVRYERPPRNWWRSSTARCPHPWNHCSSCAASPARLPTSCWGEAFGIPSGVVVDTHVARLSQRLGLTKHTDPVQIEQDLTNLIDRKAWVFTGIGLIFHGRRVCEARRPQCDACTLNDICPSATTPNRPARSPYSDTGAAQA